LFGFLLVLSFLVGCDSIGPGLATVMPSPTPYPACEVKNGFYLATEGPLAVQKQHVDTKAGEIFVEAMQARSAGDEVRLAGARSQALQLLAYETLRWSDVETMQLDGKNLRLIVTFISPELLQTVVLNQVISGNVTVPGNNFSEYTKIIFQGMDQRGEYMFLLTIQAELPEQARLPVELKPMEIYLKKSEKLRIPANLVDNAFTQPFDMSSSSQRAGFIYFPQAVFHDGSCQLVLDAFHDNFIIMDMENTKIDDQKGPLEFQIVFAPPLNMEISIPTPNPALPLTSEQHKSSGVLPAIQDVGPTGVLNSLTADNLAYWQEMGRFVWANLTLVVPK